VQYDPTELVITVRAGTRVSVIEALLQENGQMLAFDAPLFAETSTIGGVVAAGIAGPRRPFSGAIRDSVLGVKVLDGQGQVLRFGGVVFKNVAGFDAFRLMAGGLGCLGVLLEISLRVMPIPRCERAVALELDLATARQRLTEWLQQPLPFSGACFDGQLLHLRFSGGESAVSDAVKVIGGAEDSEHFWSDLQHQRHEFFDAKGPLWRISLPATAPELALTGRCLWDWAGAQRWVNSSDPATHIRDVAANAGGHATLFRGARQGEEVFTPLPRPLFELHQRLKAVFDPAGILNPGRMYAGL
jgi:glycolate oxidase FAD binding subunit